MSLSNRQSVYSNASGAPYAGSIAPNSHGTATTSSLLSALHHAYQTGAPYPLDAGTTLVVNSGTGAGDSGYVGVIDEGIGQRAWEHARRRAEDQTILLASLQTPAPSLLLPILSTLPAAPDILTTSLNLITAFTSCLTPVSPFSVPHHNGLAVSLHISLSGAITGAHVSLSTAGLNTADGLLHIPSQEGYRAFDVFYYLLSAVSTPAEREGLGLQSPDKYTLLARSGTYSLPSYLPTADDSAAAEDWRANLRAIGIKGSLLRGLLSALHGLLKLGNSVGLLVDEEVVEDVCEDVSGLLGIEPEVLAKKMGDADRELFIATAYELLVEWVVAKANDAIASDFTMRREMESNSEGSQDGDTVQITVLELPNEKLAKAVCLKGVFDDESGLNAEMKADGVDVPVPSGTVVREMRSSWSEAEAAGLIGMSREREYENDRKENIIEKAGREVEEGGFLKEVLFPTEYGRSPEAVKADIPQLLAASRTWWHLNLAPSDDLKTGQELAPWHAAAVSRQLRSWRLPEWANRRAKRLDFTADFDFDEFSVRYGPLGCSGARDGIESWVLERGWSNGEVVVGHERVWVREGSWWESENMLDLKQPGVPPGMLGLGSGPMDTGYTANGSGYFPAMGGLQPSDSREGLLRSTSGMGGMVGANSPGNGSDDYSKGMQAKYEQNHYTAEIDPEIGEPKHVEEQPISRGRKTWVAFCWAITWWIPSFLLRHIGRMKRPDVRQAWREKFTLMVIIFLLNAIVIFWITAFSRLLCPDYSKAWNQDEVSHHQGESDVWVTIFGNVYDITKFVPLQHSDTNTDTTKSSMMQFAGQEISAYFPPLIYLACPDLVSSTNGKTLTMKYNDTSAQEISSAVHTSGSLQADTTSKLHDPDWFSKVFQPRIKEYWTADLVVTKSDVLKGGTDGTFDWAIIDGKIYDLTNYFYTVDQNPDSGEAANTQTYDYLDPTLTQLFKDNPGEDITSDFREKLNHTAQDQNLRCLENLFYAGKLDFRQSPRCQVNTWILIAFAGIMGSVILVKFLSALQLGTKRRPAQQDKFVICQIPAYTEGEDSIRKAVDSLTALNYDNKRKLMFLICDGMIVGGGNDRPTPNIVLEILGVDPKVDPPALPFKSVGEGSKQLNYGKVYSGLYEYEGCVVPYVVVVKVGKPSESSRPGNRGKRDSQILLMEFLNRVHHRSAMSPLQLEIFHQINNIIGVDPELYEYVLMVDADTSVKEDSLNRLVAACANDAKIVGICGETSLENEEGSWWTMIQVYEYYISHHLAKAFESLFGSVTCLPGCFCMYRLRTADKGRPLIISNKVIDEYSDGNVDTLHKKNLLSLGEDRYLTTLMTKHFPSMHFKFVPDAYALTAAPETWGVLLSQRRRWINSTIHNLAELIFLDELCGMCCFSMRFIVFMDLFGTIILPATCVYLGYLIYVVAAKQGPLPVIAIAMLAGVYALQAIIFILKRQWQHVGWMIIYLIAFPIYSFVLPVYSFWCQDDFSWGTTRIVVGEKGNKKLVATDDEGFDPRSIPLQTWDDYANQNRLPGRRGGGSEKFTGRPGPYDDAYEMDDIHSTYSSVKPASTILTGLPQMGGQHYMPPQSPAPFGNNRQSTYSAYTNLTGLDPGHQRLMSMGGMSAGDYWQEGPNQHRPMSHGVPSTDNLVAMNTPPPRGPSRSPLGGNAGSRPASAMDFMRAGGGPSDESIIDAIRSVLREVDLETITKKQVRALVEQRLQTECQGDRRTFLDKQIDAELANMPM